MGFNRLIYPSLNPLKSSNPVIDIELLSFNVNVIASSSKILSDGNATIGGSFLGNTFEMVTVDIGFEDAIGNNKYIIGNFDYKNICLQIKIRENLTDTRIVEFIKNWDFTEKQYDTFFNSIWDSISNETSQKIVEFFINYHDGLLLPDRCGAYEPLGHKFNKDDISDPVKWMSQPGWGLMLKKKYKFRNCFEFLILFCLA